ncbi:MAG: hypothetical protein ACRDRI_22960 [Pseudonocardiaceae bacterium]
MTGLERAGRPGQPSTCTRRRPRSWLSAQPGDEAILGPPSVARLTRDYEVILL